MTDAATVSVFDHPALAAHAAWREREQAINALLMDAGWTPGDPLVTVVRGMRQDQRDALVRLLGEQADGH